MRGSEGFLVAVKPQITFFRGPVPRLRILCTSSSRQPTSYTAELVSSYPTSTRTYLSKYLVTILYSQGLGRRPPHHRICTDLHTTVTHTYWKYLSLYPILVTPLPRRSFPSQGYLGSHRDANTGFPIPIQRADLPPRYGLGKVGWSVTERVWSYATVCARVERNG